MDYARVWGILPLKSGFRTAIRRSVMSVARTLIVEVLRFDRGSSPRPRAAPHRPAMLRASGRVVRQTKRTVFCSAELHDADGNHLASARCTQVLLPQR